MLKFAECVRRPIEVVVAHAQKQRAYIAVSRPRHRSQLSGFGWPFGQFKLKMMRCGVFGEAGVNVFEIIVRD